MYNKLLSDPASVPVDCPLLVLVEAYRLLSWTWDVFYHLCSSGKILAEEAMKPLRFTTGCNTKSIFIFIPVADHIETEIQSPVPSPGRWKPLYLPTRLAGCGFWLGLENISRERDGQVKYDLQTAGERRRGGRVWDEGWGMRGEDERRRREGEHASIAN